MSDLFNELNEIIGEGLFKNIEPTLNLNKGEDRVSDIDRLRELSDAVLIDKHWADAEEQEFMVEVRFFVNASSNEEATLIVDKAINTAKLNEIEAWQIELSEEV